MPLSWNEIRSRAVEFSKRWEHETSEDAEAKAFWTEFLNIFGIDRKRVATRVAQGGHNIPETTIRRRFVSGIKNFACYKLLVNDWQLYDNSAAPTILLGEGGLP